MPGAPHGSSVHYPKSKASTPNISIILWSLDKAEADRGLWGTAWGFCTLPQVKSVHSNISIFRIWMGSWGICKNKKLWAIRTVLLDKNTQQRYNLREKKSLPQPIKHTWTVMWLTLPYPNTAIFLLSIMRHRLSAVLFCFFYFCEVMK